MNIRNLETEKKELFAAVAKKLLDRKETVTTAESCTGGLLSAALTSVPGSSGFFDLGVTTYSNDAKNKLLNVSQHLLNNYGAVSSQVAEAMACGALQNSGADYALSVTGIAGPGGATTAKPVGLVFIGLADKHGVVSVKNNFSGDRDAVRKQTVVAALQMLNERLHADGN